MHPVYNLVHKRFCELHDSEIEAGGFGDTAFWTAVSDAGLQRTTVAPEVTNKTPYKLLLIQHQGRTEELLNADTGRRGIKFRRSFELLDYEYIDNRDYPICAYVKDIHRGEVDKVHCAYLVAADGASSQTRDLAHVSSSVHQSHGCSFCRLGGWQRSWCKTLHSDNRILNYAESQSWWESIGEVWFEDRMYGRQRARS